MHGLGHTPGLGGALFVEGGVPLDGTLRSIVDRSGNVSTLKLSTGAVEFIGTTIDIQTTSVEVADKIIILNQGEVGDGVGGDGYSGIEIDRGNFTNKTLFWDESDDKLKFGTPGGQCQEVSLINDPLGTIATQDADAVDIDGGTIDGCAIGGTTPLTSLAIDNITIDSSTIQMIDSQGLVIKADGTGTHFMWSAGASNKVLTLVDDTAYALGVGGGLHLKGRYNATPSRADFAIIKGIKEDATSGNQQGALVFQVNSGSALVEAARFGSNKKLTLAGTLEASALIWENLPTADPAVAGQVFRTGNDLRISTG